MVIFPQSIGLLRNAWGSFSAPNSPNPVALNGRRNSFQVTICHYFFCTVYTIATMFHYFYFPYSFYNKIRVRFSFHIKKCNRNHSNGIRIQQRETTYLFVYSS
uniref:Uncharacterized protein n=1 Tax=Cacopsylla melanoneura TaxID=428564 RepID=A0A8D8VUF5_9HEMI